jgi:hypothetical protein
MHKYNLLDIDIMDVSGSACCHTNVGFCMLNMDKI